MDVQRKIVLLLDAANKEINLQLELAEKIKTEKRSLLQQLLSGNWRVRIAK